MQCTHPEWNFVFDELPDIARTTRRSFLERHCEASTLILATHFPSPSLGHFKRRGDAFHYDYL